MIFGIIERLKSVPRTPSAAVRVLMYILCPSEGTGFSLIVARNFPPAVRLPSACLATLRRRHFRFRPQGQDGTIVNFKRMRLFIGGNKAVAFKDMPLSQQGFSSLGINDNSITF